MIKTKQAMLLLLAGTIAGLTLPANAMEVKDPNPPPQIPGAAPETTGGPDAFGYTFFDSLEPNCTNGFIDISGTGTFVVDGDDTAGTVTMGAAFNLYGTSLTQLNMTSNGYLSSLTTDTGPDLSNDCPLPVTPSTGGGARIYPLHDDLNLVSGTGSGLYQFFPVCPRANERCAAQAGGPVDESCSVFQWNDAEHFGGGGPFDFQAILYHGTNDIVVQVGPGNPETGSGSTTGLQNLGATIGLTYACNVAGSVPDNRAVCFAHPNDISTFCAPLEADLDLTKTADVTSAAPGSNFFYNLTVDNLGPAAATGVVVTDTLPAGVTLVATSGCAEDPVGVPTCTLGDIANGAAAAYSIEVTVNANAAGVLVNTATATAQNADPATGNNTDAFTVSVQQNVLEIPTASTVGLLLLGLLLGTGGALMLWRRR